MNQSEVNAFVREGLQMKTFDHPNVMELFGICWSSDPGHARHNSPLIVLPYMELGDLKNYLRKCRPGMRSMHSLLKEPTEGSTGSASREAPLTAISTLQLVKFAHQIARGMEYIADKGIVHRDLATRNCMIDWDLKIKVADFGLARTMANGKDYYRMGQGGQLPIRWMAIESLLDFVFTTKSDVVSLCKENRCW
jgi:serine/threonine protein kinase